MLSVITLILDQKFIMDIIQIIIKIKLIKLWLVYIGRVKIKNLRTLSQSDGLVNVEMLSQ